MSVAMPPFFQQGIQYDDNGSPRRMMTRLYAAHEALTFSTQKPTTVTESQKQYHFIQIRRRHPTNVVQRPETGDSKRELCVVGGREREEWEATDVSVCSGTKVAMERIDVFVCYRAMLRQGGKF